MSQTEQDLDDELPQRSLLIERILLWGLIGFEAVVGIAAIAAIITADLSREQIDFRPWAIPLVLGMLPVAMSVGVALWLISLSRRRSQE